MAAAKNRGLGKGLDALFSTSEIDTKKINSEKADEIRAQGIEFIDINDIKPNENQPRKVFDDVKLQELANSIKEHGLIQPVILRQAKKGYEIVAGERRWRACRKAGLKEIPCMIKELTDEQNMLVAIIENMQREDLNPIEEAEGLNQMISSFGMTQEEVSKSVGKSRPYITNSLRLLKLPQEVRNMVSQGKLTTGHARAIAGIGDRERQIQLAEYVIKEELSVREVERLIKEQHSSKKKNPRRKAEKSADVKRVEEDLKHIMGTKVSLNQSGRKGKIEIEYYSRDELERLIELLKSLQ
ncbi:ParB/RepB/Spo0J family partition protein [Ihubacter massiliensis]|uniref:ParB/RepB/Spo0J family partition protein n=1 Tax=Hominibacterium faecale TaxID=2839743 RepID=A0A9J6QIG8_9FIRM|nr:MULTISPECIES: ParB/RepB/Spo0J family partition protein [Eubacteriales Family XIII. Incertae Sedis]MCI7303392.1 ParB/RepB/Spo0J family partition protein [Clostridia bacterium]MCO7123036.1 ParB/RepB/Spo0J family partition protein [Ihubacter massiliensis]MCU7377296.1 ParB/RepB/Spo0J family partition protein [Hominibacterium faecale]MDY3009799.1 ParB/RepB/Spo0J family partition protein [Clostridiales Family XIII bacterium]